ncbi:MAG TPA: hypothetical protein VGX78_22930 [Pirellulales bacterium]|jgi:hypothetical protein|nr:hypothetical protein [Pirellulales bacterium]
MPRHILKPDPRSPRFDDIVARLVREFEQAAPGTSPQPVIIEQHVPSTGSRHLHVIWDEWRRIPEMQRSEIIVDAYRRAEGEPAADEVTIAVGATVQEAMALGLLPFKIVPSRKANGPISLDAYRQAFESEAAQTLAGANANELRYATMADAEQGLRRVESALPGSSWLIVQEVGVEN